MDQNIEKKLRTLAQHAWDDEVRWPAISAWSKNFTGEVLTADEEQKYSLFMLSRFVYFGKKLVREMLRSLYRDNFEAPIRQRIRRNMRDSWDRVGINNLFAQELRATRFVGVGNPSESGAHLLYYFRQVNYLPKDLFIDINSAFTPVIESGALKYLPREPNVTRYVFFDDLVGSGTQASSYLATQLKRMRESSPNLDIRFMSLFASADGLKKLNAKSLFNNAASCLFELDSSFKAFGPESRYFVGAPSWFNVDIARALALHYGQNLYGDPLGYKDGQLLLGFSHNTPDNTLPIFWNEGRKAPWVPIFIRFDKVY
jgi:hypothetical protein